MAPRSVVASIIIYLLFKLLVLMELIIMNCVLKKESGSFSLEVIAQRLTIIYAVLSHHPIEAVERSHGELNAVLQRRHRCY